MIYTSISFFLTSCSYLPKSWEKEIEAAMFPERVKKREEQKKREEEAKKRQAEEEAREANTPRKKYSNRFLLFYLYIYKKYGEYDAKEFSENERIWKNREEIKCEKQAKLGKINEEACMDKAFEERQKYFDAISDSGI